MIALLNHIVSPTAEIVTVIEGAEAPSSVTASIVEWIHEHRPGAQAEVLRGGQQLYPYLFGVE